MTLAPPPFRFSAKRTRIDWQTLHGVDIQRLVRRLARSALENIQLEWSAAQAA